MHLRHLTAALCSLTLLASAHAQTRIQPVEHTYKTVGERELKLLVFAGPAEEGEKRPAIVLFHGGGWAKGGPGQFRIHAEYLAMRGMVAITPEYRLFGQGETKITDCIADAKSAMRWVRSHAAELGIDPDRIAAGGGSAGGHLAACTATIDSFDDPADDLSISAKPAALVLFNPVAALTPHEGDDSFNPNWIAKRAGVDLKQICPTAHVDGNLPPTFMCYGSEDGFLPGGRAFEAAMKEQGIPCDLQTWEGEGHGFFNFGRKNAQSFVETLEAADAFLVKLGYIEGDPTLREWAPVKRQMEKRAEE